MVAVRPETPTEAPLLANSWLMPLPGVKHRLKLRQGATLAEEKARWGCSDNKKLVVFINGKVCMDDSHALMEWDYVVFVVEPAGGLKKIIGLVAVVALSVALPIATTALIGAGFSTFTAGLITAGIGLVGTLAINALFPPPGQPAPEALPSTRQLYSLTSIRNSANPYGIVPMVLGKHKMYPQLASRPYTEIVANDQVLHMVFGWLGKGTMENLRIGNTPITDYEGIETELHQPDFATGLAPDFRIVKRQVRQESLGVDLSFDYGDNIPNSYGASQVTTPPQGWHYRTLSPGSTGIGLEFQLPRGLGIYQEVKKKRDMANLPRTVEIEAQYRPVTDNQWYGISWEEQGAFKQRSTNNAGNVNTLGGQRAAIALFNLNVFRPASTFPQAQQRTLVISGSHIGQPLRRAVFGTVPPGDYEVRVRLRSSRSNAKRKILQVADQVLWTALKSYKDDKPVIDSELSVLEMKATASRQLSGSIDSLNFLWKAESDYLWNGTAWTTGHTENPASWYLHVLLGRHSPVYGQETLDDTIQEDFQEWYDYCAFKGWTFNKVVDSGVNLWDLLKDIAAAGRASPAIKDGKHTIIIDRANPIITQVFTSANSSNYVGSIKYRTLPHGLKVQFLDEQKDYAQTQLIVYRDGYSADGADGTTEATQFELLSMPGITTNTLAYKHARNYFEQALLRPEEHTIEVDIDNLIAQRGDHVRFSHEVNSTSYGAGRVKAYDTATRMLTFDRPIALRHDQNTRIQIFFGPGMRETSWWTFLPSATGFQTTVQLGIAPSATQISQIVGKSFVIGQLDRFALDCIVSRIEPLPNLRARIAMVAYNLASYDDESLPVPTWDPGTIRQIGHTGVAQPFPPLAPLGPAPARPEIYEVSEDGGIRVLEPASENLPVSFDPITGAPIYVQRPLPPWEVAHDSSIDAMLLADDVLVQRILFTWKANPLDDWDIKDLVLVVEGKRSEEDGTAWEELGSAPGTEGQLYLTNVEEGQFWDFRLYFKSIKEVRSSDFVTLNLVQIIGRGGPPSAPDTLFINGKTLSWVHENPPLDVLYGGGYQLRYHFGNNDNWDTAIPLHNKILKASPFTLDRWDDFNPYTFMLKTIDGLGIESDDFAVLRHNFGDRTDKDLIQRTSFNIRDANELTDDGYPELGNVFYTSTTTMQLQTTSHTASGAVRPGGDEIDTAGVLYSGYYPQRFVPPGPVPPFIAAGGRILEGNMGVLVVVRHSDNLHEPIGVYIAHPSFPAFTFSDGRRWNLTSLTLTTTTYADSVNPSRTNTYTFTSGFVRRSVLGVTAFHVPTQSGLLTLANLSRIAWSANYEAVMNVPVVTRTRHVVDDENTLYYRNGNLQGGTLSPSRSNTNFWTNDDLPFWATNLPPGHASDMAAFWDSQHWNELEVFWRFAIAEQDVEDKLSLEYSDLSGQETLEYRRYGIKPFWTNDADNFWDVLGDPAPVTLTLEADITPGDGTVSAPGGGVTGYWANGVTDYAFSYVPARSGWGMISAGADARWNFLIVRSGLLYAPRFTGLILDSINVKRTANSNSALPDAIDETLDSGFTSVDGIPTLFPNIKAWRVSIGARGTALRSRGGVTVFSEPYGVEVTLNYSRDPALAANDNAFWQIGDGSWKSMSGKQIGDRLEEGVYEFRIRIPEGVPDTERIELTQLSVALDGVDKVEHHEDITIDADGSSKLRLHNSYPRAQAVGYSLQDSGTDVWRILIVKRPQELGLRAFDQYGNLVSASVDLTIRGY